ncbi:unnamed protein product [Cladocopium goreaui]|uniref:LSM12 anticodon-binding domain-containing protein n=1 Tax=Cladocopium goreaui TaxID=2562237 RepID=A0A9P1FUB4_9DINO|nr:unnamed protein product [Cladocopium goreaui]
MDYGCNVGIPAEKYQLFGTAVAECRGDEGVILDINEECRNCTVVFDGRPEKIQVALKHLRVIGQSTNGGNGADAGARSQKVVAKQIAEEMRLVDLPAVQALDSELQGLRNALQSAQKKLTSYEARDEKQAQEILQLTRELSSVKEEELQADLAVARAEAASQEMMAQVALHRQELAEEQRLTAFLRQQLEDVPQQEAKILKELELLRSEYQALAAKDSSQAWKSEAAACETLSAEMAAEQARHELELVQTAEGGLPEIHSSEVQNAVFQGAEDALDDDGRSALDYARAQQQEEVMRLLDPKAETSFGEQHGQAFHHFVPAEGPSAFDHFNAYGANTRPEAFGVATEGPSAADHFNVSKAQTPPPPSSPWGVEALREKEDLGRRARPAAEEPQEQSDIDNSTVKPGDGQEGSLRKRLGKGPTWSQQVSPGRRADECDDEASWGSWF